MKSIRIFTLLAAALLLFSSCAGEGTEEPAASSEPAQTEPEREVYTVVSDGASDYVIVRADNISEEALKKALELRRGIKDKYGFDMTISSDWSRDNKDNNTVESSAEVREILIGNTNRAETRAIAAEYKDLGYGYVIKATNGKIVIWGSESETLSYALTYFTENLLTDNALEMYADFEFVWDLKGEGMPLTVISEEYTVICSRSDAEKIQNSANLLSTYISELSGKKPQVAYDSKTTDKSGKEILVGNTDRAESTVDGIGYMDYVIRVTGNKIVILGGSPLSTRTAIETFVSLIKDGSISSLENDFEYKSNYHALIADSLAFKIDSFVPNWANEFTVPAWMTDFEEKLYALTSPAGRMTADAHRGDVQNYPENSLEGILSAIMMGADVIEIDIRLTKDNVMVLMHDASLKRTTDCSLKMGKNGLPSSDQVEDWTYEQLRELRLLYNGKATDSLIPTMYEAALLFAGRSQIHFDCKVSDKIDKNSDVFLLAEATGSKESFVYYYGLETMQKWVTLNKEDKDFTAFVVKMRKYLTTPGNSLRRRNFDMITKYGDTPNGWIAGWNEGYKMTFTNKIYDFSKYLAANHEPIKLP